MPAVNQIELHPHLQNRAVAAYDSARGIVTESWSPIAQGAALLAIRRSLDRGAAR